MHFVLLLLAVPLVLSLPQATQPSYTKLSEEQLKHLQNKGFGPTVPSAFRPTASYEDDREELEDENDDTEVAQTQARVPVYSEDNYPNSIHIQQRPQVRQQSQPQPVQRRPVQQYRPQYVEVEPEVDPKKKEKEEEEEPDRLSLLLPNTKFSCQGKNTGYYADEELGCEVFHYCQDNARHSWICPEGFTFHQVHLICMLPGGDNVCETSHKFHFVNDYLYRPINLEEHQKKPNVSLKYSDRYFPENYYSYEEEDNQQQYRKQPVRQHQEVDEQRHEQVVVRRPTLRPETTVGQVFRSPEEINISLQQRRPQYATQRYNVEY